MFRGNVGPEGAYNVHHNGCSMVEAGINRTEGRYRAWWHGPFDLFIEALLPGVKGGNTIRLCTNCDPLSHTTPREREYVQTLSEYVSPRG